MTDELLYERLAISIANTHSPLPRVHGEVVSNINQLYPLLIAPAFRQAAIVARVPPGARPERVRHELGGDPCVPARPAFDLQSILPFVVAVATVTVPWITLSSFLLTEVAAYPAFVWALLGIQASVARPSVRNDLLAVAAIALAVLARTQFYALAAVLPAVLVADALVGRRLRAALREHVALVATYAIGAVCALVLFVTGHALLGTYSQTAKGNPLPRQIFESVPAHLAVVALAGGLLPFLLGGAWAVANILRSRTRRAARLRVADGRDGRRAHGRGRVVQPAIRRRTRARALSLLSHAAPALRIRRGVDGGTACRAGRCSRRSSIVIIGFWRAPFPTFEKLNVDTPASVLYDWLLSTMHGLGGARVALDPVCRRRRAARARGDALFPRTPFAVGTLLAAARRVGGRDGLRVQAPLRGQRDFGLPLTLDQSPVFGWVDGQINGDSVASIVPYPMLATTTGRMSVSGGTSSSGTARCSTRSGDPMSSPATPGGTFPKSFIRFDAADRCGQCLVPRLRRASRQRVALPSHGRDPRDETQLRPDPDGRAMARGLAHLGLYDDGWTKPGRRRLVEDLRGCAVQQRSLRRSVTFALGAPAGVEARARSRFDRIRAPGARVSRTLGQPGGHRLRSALRASARSRFASDRQRRRFPATRRTSTTFQQPRAGGVLSGRSRSRTKSRTASCAPSR